MNVALRKSPKLTNGDRACGLGPEKHDTSDGSNRGQAECDRVRPADLAALRRQHLQRHHGHHERQHTRRVECVVARCSRLTLWCAAYHQHPEHRHRHRREEDPTPTNVLCHQATEEGGEPRATPGSHRPEADGTLSAGVVPVGLDERETRRHDEGARQALTDAAQHQQRHGHPAGWRHADEERADDAQHKAPHQDLDAPDAIGQTAHDNDEDAREQGRDRHGDVHDVCGDVEVGRHRRRDVKGGLGEQPERQNAENDPEEELVIASVIGRRSGHHLNSPRS